MSKILTMLKLQQKLNDSTNGENWEAGTTKNGKKIDWKRCIYMESAEMVDSFAWKHWKAITADSDWDNHKIEVIDVWHFVMSLALQEYKMNNLGSIKDIELWIGSNSNYKNIENDNETYSDIDPLLIKIEELMLDSLTRTNFDINTMLDHFFELVSMSGLNLDSLYSLYVGKNILNQFRQDHGYKEGTYIKVWNDKEDNMVMKSFWEKDSNLTPESLYNNLEEVYKTL
ncbi:MAG: dUTPase [Helicobacteraceae bacterium]|nr:dUTPase [Helicobacteraceae bacterium]